VPIIDYTGVEWFTGVDTLFVTHSTGQFLYWPQVMPPHAQHLYVEALHPTPVIGPFTTAMPELRSVYLRELQFPSGESLPIPPGVTHLKILGCTYDTPIAFPEGLDHLEYRQESSEPGSVVPGPWPSDLDTLIMYGSDPYATAMIQTLLNAPLPAGLKDMQIELLFSASEETIVIPDLPTELATLDLSYARFILPEVLPASLRSLRMHDHYDHIEQEPACLPFLPLGLEELDLYYNSGDGPECLPNMPLGIADELGWMPVCTIWNSTCLGGNEIQGTVYNDLDNNGSMDLGEAGLPNANVVVQPGNVITSAANVGAYSAWVSAGNFTIEALPYLYQTPTGTPQTADFLDVGGQDLGNNVGLYLTPDIQDIRSSMSNTLARPGFDNNVWFGWQNVGTTDVTGTVRFTFDAQQSFVSAVPAPSSVNGNVIEWPLSVLMGSPGGSAYVVLHTDVSVTLGTELVMELVADPVATDETPEDNTVIITTPVVGSFDPNDITVDPGTMTLPELAEGKKLEYTIRFQNTGTYLAEDVLVTDMLPEGLVPTTFEFIGSSHPCQWYISNGQLQFMFDQIMLPDSNANETGSHGYVKFRIAPQADLQPGESIENIASIIFDFNSPIVTAPAVFTLHDPTTVPELHQELLGLYPNPVDDVLWLRADATLRGQVRMEVLDLSGREVLEQLLATSSGPVDVSTLPSGLYQVRSHTAGRLLTGRFVKR
jgi:uncharacterized repeat protein (TIGR01451 family)